MCNSPLSEASAHTAKTRVVGTKKSVTCHDSTCVSFAVAMPSMGRSAVFESMRSCLLHVCPSSNGCISHRCLG